MQAFIGELIAFSLLFELPAFLRFDQVFTSPPNDAENCESFRWHLPSIRQSKRHYTTRTRQIFNVKSAKNIAISALTQHFSSSSSFATFCQFLVRLVAIRLFFIHYLYRMLPKMLLLQFSRFRKSLAAHLFPSNKCLPFLHWRNCPSRQFQIGSIKKPHNGPKATTSVPKTSFLC